MRTIMVWNKKGGVGKTTTVANLAVNLADIGNKVLIIDLDCQSNLTDMFGVKTDIVNTMYDLIMDVNKGDINVGDVILSVRENLDIIPSENKIWRTNIHMARFINNSEKFMEKIMTDIKNIKDYDYIFFDCPPNMSLLHYNVLVSCDEIFVPVAMDYLSLLGASHVYNELNWVKNENKNCTADITTVIPTFVDRRNKRTDIIIETLKETFRHRLTTPIRICTKIAEAPGHHMIMKDYAPNSTGAEDYDDLTDRIISDTEIIKSSISKRIREDKIVKINEMEKEIATK